VALPSFPLSGVTSNYGTDVVKRGGHAGVTRLLETHYAYAISLGSLQRRFPPATDPHGSPHVLGPSAR